MENDQLIAVETFCTFYHVEYSFVESLQKSEMIDTVVVNDSRYLQIPELKKIERIVRLYHDLDINLAGIEAIDTLLHRIHIQDQEIQLLKNKLRFYQPDI